MQIEEAQTNFKQEKHKDFQWDTLRSNCGRTKRESWKQQGKNNVSCTSILNKAIGEFLSRKLAGQKAMEW